jgi:pimeloyl-ACP methyl ester carboxylesterase
MLRALRLVPVILAGVLFLPALWNLAAAKYQHARHPAPGEFHEIEGRAMHLYCSGNGPYTVVIEVGASSHSVGWRSIQETLSRATRVCTYDRSGHGWSESAAGPHDAATIARKLHELLDQASVARPLILLAHSAGGLYIREYARQFPRDIAGAVMVDSSSPAQIDELPGWRQDWEQDKRNLPGDIWRDRLRVWSGWNRLTGQCHDEPPKGLNYLAGEYDAEMCRDEYAGQEDNELPYFEDSLRQAGRLTWFGARPLAVISRDTFGGKKEDLIWDREQEQLKSLSPNSWRVIARGAPHDLLHSRPELVTGETVLLIGYLRGVLVPPFGTTAAK